MGAVRRLCSSGILLDHGHISFEGTAGNTIEHYLQSIISKADSFIEFPDMPGKEMYIKKIELVDKNGSSKKSFSISESVFIRVTTVANQNLENINLAFSVNRNGERMFSSWDIDEHQEFLRRDRGKYVHLIEISPILNKGIYSISIEAGHPNQGTVDSHLDCLSFEIDHFLVDGSAKGFSRGGIICPKVKWSLFPAGMN